MNAAEASASERMWSLVCGLPHRLRGNRNIMMFKAYIDDSGMNQPPVSILAGWLGPVKVWAEFSDEWDKILRMSPRIEYFKYVEAFTRSGQFSGMSEDARIEKCRLLVKCIEDHNLVGVATVVPHAVFNHYFGKDNDKGALRHPYPLSFFQIMSRLHRYCFAAGIHGKIDFVFDEQHDQMLKVLAGWQDFLAFCPDEMREFVGSPPSFASDLDILPLQAADLHAGWVRQLDASVFEGNNVPEPIWGDAGKNIQRLNWILYPDVAEGMFIRINGFKPAPFSHPYPFPHDQIE